jgi:hypothetical protein
MVKLKQTISFLSRVKSTIKEYPLFEKDAKQWGIDTAFYNAGFLAGDSNGYEEGFKRAIILIYGKRKGKWSKLERKLANEVLRPKASGSKKRSK